MSVSLKEFFKIFGKDIMLNRRILRMKAFKVLYSYAVTGRTTLDDAMKELELSCEATRDLYLWMLSLISPLTREAANRILLARNKYNPTEEELNPNVKFAENKLAEFFDADPDFQKMISRKGLSWDQYDILVKSIFGSMQERDYFKKYMEAPATSLKADCKLFIKVFEKELADNEQLAKILEDKSIYWIDDLAYALTYCCRTLEDVAKGNQWRLPELYQSDMIRQKNPDSDVQSDKAFVTRLLKNAFAGYEGYFSLISSSLNGWDSDRLNSSDIALVVLGLAEAETFPDIPLRVTINEYVEISKYYSLPKSRSFVNGLLDRLITKLQEEGKIKKTI